jgi:hypothetical protein
MVGEAAPRVAVTSMAMNDQYHIKFIIQYTSQHPAERHHCGSGLGLTYI